MNVHANNQDDTKSSTTLLEASKSMLLSKAPWYKEVAGFVAVVSWLAIIGLNTWAIVVDTTIPRPYYLVILYAVALGASVLRNASPRVTLEKPEL